MRLKEEIWKPITGYGGLYEISNFGRVKKIRMIKTRRKSKPFELKETVLKGGISGSGYPFVALNGKNHSRHRLVAQVFIPNPNNFTDVNHIDGNKLNSSVENLEWCTRSQNLKHGLKIGLIESQCKIRRKVTVTFEGNKQIEFSSMTACCNFFNYTKCWLGNYVRKHGNPCRYGEFTIHVSERE